MAAFGAVGEFALAEFPIVLTVAITASDTLTPRLDEGAPAIAATFLRADAIVVSTLDVARAFGPPVLGEGDVITVAREDRTIIVLRNGRAVTRDDLSGG